MGKKPAKISSRPSDRDKVRLMNRDPLQTSPTFRSWRM